jgi:hypothetical protein
MKDVIHRRPDSRLRLERKGFSPFLLTVENRAPERALSILLMKKRTHASPPMTSLIALMRSMHATYRFKRRRHVSWSCADHKVLAFFSTPWRCSSDKNLLTITLMSEKSHLHSHPLSFGRVLSHPRFEQSEDKFNHETTTD